MIQININLKIGLKGQYSLISLIKIIEYFQKNNSNEDEYKPILILLIKSIFDEKQFLLENKISQLKEALKEQIEIFINNNFSDGLIMKILIYKLLQFMRIEDYKLELIKVLFEVPRLIKYSSLFFNYIFLSPNLSKLMKLNMVESNENNKEKKDQYLNNFGLLKNEKKEIILLEINTKSENNEIFKEILMYIFEMRIKSYFDEYYNKYSIRKNPILLLTNINFDYFKKAFDNINNFEKLKNLDIIYYFSYLRTYLYYFVKFQIKNKNEIGGLEKIHDFLYNNSNSGLGKMILLYIAKLFILNDKQEYFFDDYLNDKEKNWKNAIIFKNEKLELFPIINYENSKNLLFIIWSKINNNNLNEDLIKNLDIKDFYYIINFAYNEISKKIKENKLEKSKLLSKLNETIDNLDNLSFSIDVNEKFKKLFNKISILDFYNDKQIQSNLKLIFNMIRIYVIAFIGYKKNNLFSLILSENISTLIKLFYNEDLNNQYQYIDNYYKIKSYLEHEYIINDNYFPAYACSICGNYYFHKDKNSFPVSINNCKCNSNYYAIYYDDNQKEYIESGRGSKFSHCKFKGKLLKEYKNEFIIETLVKKSLNLKELILNNEEINDETFSKIFMNFIFLLQVFIEYKIDIMTEEEKTKEFGNLNLLSKIISLNVAINNYMDNKEINYHCFMNYFCDSYANLLENNDCLKNKDIYKKYFEDLIKKKIVEQNFNNIETNILTTLTIDPIFKNENYKYLSSVAQYPNEDILKKSISSYKKKDKNPLIMLNILGAIKNNKKDKDEIDKLSHIENINEFINSFSEEFNNIISRENSEIKTIDYYLRDNRTRLYILDNEISPLEKKFNNFCKSYKEISIDLGDIYSNITRENEVCNILNDEIKSTIKNNKKKEENNNKIEIKRSTINKLYNNLRNIQNKFLNQIISNFKENKMKEDIIIKNYIDQIKQEIPIQLATKNDIFSLKYSDGPIISFEELYSFYSSKNIFNKDNDKIDYSKYSQIKFKLNIIERELTNNLLTGKKLFSEKQIKYKFYSDPYDVEEKTKAFEEFTKLYDKEIINEDEKKDLKKVIDNLKKIILQNLEILIFYLIKENKYLGSQRISEIKIPENLYLNKTIIQLFNDCKAFTINKLVSIYEYIEEQIWETIVDRYVNPKFKISGFWNNNCDYLETFYNNEDKRELKNDILASLLIKFICRYLPYGTKKIDSNKNLFEMIIVKNTNLSKNQQIELENLKKEIYAKVSDAIDITKKLVQKNEMKNLGQKENIRIEENKNGINEDVDEDEDEDTNDIEENNDDEDDRMM